MTSHNPQIALPALGLQATAFYRHLLEKALWEKYGDRGYCHILTPEFDFSRINAHLPNQYDSLKPLLASLFEDLEGADVDIILLPNITLHAAIDRLRLSQSLRARIVHPLISGIERISADDCGKITLLGTRHTMQSDQLACYFEQKNIRVLRPHPDDIQRLDKLRLSVFETGFSGTLEAEFLRLCSAYPNCVVACTELSMLNTANRYYDLARLQIEKALSQLPTSLTAGNS